MQLSLPNPTVYEIGVGDLFTAKSRQFWDAPGASITLVEPHPLLYSSLLHKTSARPNIRLLNVAVAGENRLGHLVNAGVLSYLPAIPSPINTIFRGKLTPMMEAVQLVVPYVTMDRIDPGNIDVLILGMEGSEAAVFDHLVSRPHVIILNNHFANDYTYAFPRWDDIQAWAVAEGYDIHPGVPDIVLVNRASVVAGIVAL